MRIGITINTAWNIYNFRKGLIRTLQAEGHQIVAIAPKDEFSERLVSELNCEFAALNMDKKGTNPFKDFSLIWQLRQLYKEAKLDVVLQFTIKPNIYGAMAAALLGIPSINNVTGLGTVFIRKGMMFEVAKILYRFAFRYPKVVFFQNEDDKEVFLKNKLVPKAIVDLVPGSGINLQEFQPTTFMRNKRFTFLMVSRVLYDKGIIEYIDAIRMLRQQGFSYTFKLLGGINEANGLGVPKSQVEAWVKEGLIAYLGTTDDVRSYIEDADCIVLPSYREGTPRTLIEAASMGKPIVTTNVAGCKETVINGYNGFLCEVRNATDLAQKFQKMAELDTSTLMKMGKHSRQLAESKFDEQLVINRYKHHINQVLGIQTAKKVSAPSKLLDFVPYRSPRD
ncbi:MAG: glycosyltransferase family 4 protein [Flammeovirgaceae bacterium]